MPRPNIPLLLLTLIGACSVQEPSPPDLKFPEVPQILSFQADRSTLYKPDAGGVVFTVLATDPQGLEDLLSAALTDEAGGNYGLLQAAGPGKYTQRVDWAQIQAARSINGDTNGEARVFVAEIFDHAGNRSRSTLTVRLACRPGAGIEQMAPCGGECKDIGQNSLHCGGCGVACYGALSEYPGGGTSVCWNRVCEEVRIVTTERTNCDSACAARGGTCDHDDQCPGQICDLDERSYAEYDGGFGVPLAGCAAVPPESQMGRRFVKLGCNCRGVRAGM